MKKRNCMSTLQYLNQRTIGLTNSIGINKGIDKPLYGSLSSIRSWNPQSTSDGIDYGGIFNFDFSIDGAMLVAACEKKGLLIFDPLNASLVHSKAQAHYDSVNCVRFLDSRMFATCSDDNTVKIWDTRHLKNEVITLRGHTNWVKNVEFAQGHLITSGFDGMIYSWDINKVHSSESSSVPHNTILRVHGLMRTRVSMDGQKLIVASRLGYMLVIHDFDLETASVDLFKYRATMFGTLLGARSARSCNLSDLKNNVVKNRRNRIELISDFPEHDKAEMISSIDVHPHGWCIASRNTTFVENSEWTCMHDVQDLSPHSFDCAPDDNTTNGAAQATSPSYADTSIDNGHLYSAGTSTGPSDTTLRHSADESHGLENSRYDAIVSTSPYYGWRNFQANDGHLDLGEERVMINEFREEDGSQAFWRYMNSRIFVDDDSDTNWSDNNESHVSSDTELSQSSAEERNALYLNDLDSSTSSDDTQDGNEFNAPNNIPNGRVPVVEPPITRTASRNSALSHVKSLQTRPRLLHYIEEANVGRGFIKEISFSCDGRILASPFDRGLRLLSFDPDCRELCDCVSDSPLKLHELTANISHADIVVTTKFSPTHLLVVSGCLGGKVDFHQPVL